MLPRWHIIFGALFTILIWTSVPQIPLFYLVLIFLSSFLIDFDHYAASVLKTGRASLRKSFEYHKRMQKIERAEKEKGVRKKGDFHPFHTIEFHALVGLLSLLWVGFFYIFLGMMFHSLLDVIYLVYAGRTYRREFFFVRWVYRKLKQN